MARKRRPAVPGTRSDGGGREITLRVIPEPEEGKRTVLVMDPGADDTIFFRGEATKLAYVCGSCGAPLVVGTAPQQVQDVVLKCARCGAFNESA